jgi:hypothetical protein
VRRVKGTRFSAGDGTCYQIERLERANRAIEVGMKKPVIFTVSAIWDTDANVWSGHCDEIPAAADAPTLDELLDRISLMALDVAPDNHPGIDSGSIFIQVMALREATAVAA